MTKEGKRGGHGDTPDTPGNDSLGHVTPGHLGGGIKDRRETPTRNHGGIEVSWVNRGGWRGRYSRLSWVESEFWAVDRRGRAYAEGASSIH